MFRTQHLLTIHLPIPSYVPHERVIDALQSLSSSLDHHPLVTRYDKRVVTQSDLAALQSDPFFGPGTAHAELAIYDVGEDVVVIPGLATKAITFPAVYKRIDKGVRVRVNAAAGVVIRAEMTVERRGVVGAGGGDAGATEGKGGEGKGNQVLGSNAEFMDGEADDESEYEIVDRVMVEVSSLLLPFVKRSMTKSHRELCKGLLDEVVRRQLYK